jgi:DNA-binding MarR family transcriptional regulator
VSGGDGGRRRQLIDRILDRDRQILELSARLEATSPNELHADLTMRQLLALYLLSAGPRRVSDVGSALGISLPAASGLIDRLAAAGLVDRQRVERDRRLVLCELTDAGRQALDEVLRIGRMRLERVLTALEIADLETVERSLDILIGAAERMASIDRIATSA